MIDRGAPVLWGKVVSDEQTKQPQRNVQQHFVAAAYLVGFTPDGKRDSQLYVNERKTEKMFRSVADEAAKRRNYYSAPLDGGGFEDTVDTKLTALEAQAMPSLQKVVAGDYNLTTFERALLAFLIAFQEFRTPWTRKILAELKTESESDGSVSADQLRDALGEKRIKAKANPHADLDLIVSMGKKIGNIYTRMQWTVIRSTEGDFVTSDTPVVRRNPRFSGRLYGGGLFSPGAEVWFPLSKRAAIRISRDVSGERKFSELFKAGLIKEAQVVRSELPPVQERSVPQRVVDAINCQTITTADRFVFSSFQSDEISLLLRGESQGMRIVSSPPPPIKKKNDKI